MNVSPRLQIKHWALRYLSKPYQLGANGPHAFDCIGLVRAEYARRGVSIPAYPVTPADVLEQCRMIAEALQTSETWRRTDAPGEACAVALARDDVFSHVGLWTCADGGMVLHSREGSGVILQSLSSLKSQGWKQINFYIYGPRHIPNQPV